MRLRRSHDARAEVEAESARDDEPLTLAALAERLEQVEALVEELQDSVHRRAMRHNDEIAELHRRTDPAVLARSLAEDARARGL